MSATNRITYQTSLTGFFATMLQEIYWSEVHLVDVLTTMNGAATDTGLKESFETHRDQTKTHVARLEKIFDLLQMRPQPTLSVGLQGLFDEGWQVIDETEAGTAQRDAALIIAAQKVEHYEMACYGSLATLARTLGKIEVAELLHKTLYEEKETDALLSGLAEAGINEAAGEEEDGVRDESIGNRHGSAQTQQMSGQTYSEATSAGKCVVITIAIRAYYFCLTKALIAARYRSLVQ